MKELSIIVQHEIKSNVEMDHSANNYLKSPCIRMYLSNESDSGERALLSASYKFHKSYIAGWKVSKSN